MDRSRPCDRRVPACPDGRPDADRTVDRVWKTRTGIPGNRRKTPNPALTRNMDASSDARPSGPGRPRLRVCDLPESVSLEKHPRTRPFACSFSPRSREWHGVAKKNPAPSARATQAWPANSLPLSAVIVRTRAASGSSSSSSAAPTAAAVLRPTL